LLEVERGARGRELEAWRKGISRQSLPHQETTMRVLAAAALVLLAAACDRSNHAQRSAFVPAAPPAPSASAMMPAAAGSVAKATAVPAPGARIANAAANKSPSPGTASSAEEMYPDYAATAPGPLADFRHQQEQRDQELLNRDADDALAREQDAAQPPYQPAQEEDIPPPDEGDQGPPPPDEADMDQAPPDDDYGPPDDSPPPDDNYAPPGEYDEPPPYDH
jgi:hypothetical protein